MPLHTLDPLGGVEGSKQFCFSERGHDAYGIKENETYNNILAKIHTSPHADRFFNADNEHATA